MKKTLIAIAFNSLPDSHYVDSNKFMINPKVILSIPYRILTEPPRKIVEHPLTFFQFPTGFSLN